MWNDFENALGSFDDGEIKEMSEAAYLNYDDNYYNYDRAISDELEFSTQISEYLLEWVKSIDTKTKPKGLLLDIIMCLPMQGNNLYC